MPLCRLLLALLLVAGVSACSDGGGDAADGTTTTTLADLPPDGTAAIAALYDGRLAELGWKVQRASLERRDQPDPQADGKRHLAVYLRPTGSPTAKDYLDGLATVSRVFLPEVFERHPGLLSFDVCLEPTEAEDSSAYPSALTQVLVTRPNVGSVNWRTADAADVVAAGVLRHPNTVVLLVAPRLRSTTEWAQVEAAAQARV